METLELRPEVAAFAQLMEAKLRENDHKGGWIDMGTGWLLKRVRQETDELATPLRRYHALRQARYPNKDEVSHAARDIGKEAADVANFAMMIADVCGALASLDGKVSR